MSAFIAKFEYGSATFRTESLNFPRSDSSMKTNWTNITWQNKDGRGQSWGCPMNMNVGQSVLVLSDYLTNIFYGFRYLNVLKGAPCPWSFVLSSSVQTEWQRQCEISADHDVDDNHFAQTLFRGCNNRQFFCLWLESLFFNAAWLLPIITIMGSS